MSVRRGSGSGDLQIRTVQGANQVDHTGAANFAEVRQSELLSIQPPPGVDWEVHHIRMDGQGRTRNAVGDTADVAQYVQSEVALTFGDDITDNLESLGNVRPGNVSQNWLEEDDHVLHSSDGIMPPAANAGHAGSEHNFNEERTYADTPKLMLEDTEELTLVAANDNVVGNDYAEGGEVQVNYIGNVQVAYIPRES